MIPMFTSSVILLMVANTIAASGVALIALQASLSEALQSRSHGSAGEEHFFDRSVSAKFGMS